MGARVGRVEGVRVDAVVEQQQGLEASAALGREGGGLLVVVLGGGILLAEPLDAGQGLNAFLRSGAGVTDDALVVLGNGDLGLLDGDVIRAEAADGDRRGGARGIAEEQRRDP